MKHAKLIVNPAAGAGRTARQWPHINSLLKSIGLRFEHDVTEAPGHAVELAKSAVGQGYEMIVSVGGDGTINEIANGLYASGANGSVMLGIISTGTGSDYIRTIGVSRRVEEACRRLLEPQKLVVDLGSVEFSRNGSRVKRLFVNFAGLGFDAEVVRATTQKFKALGGKPAYLAGIFNTLLLYRNREVTLDLDGEKVESKVCTMVVSNGKYGGGSMLIAPNADPSDGFLDVMIIGDLSKPDLLWSLPRIYKGNHLTHPKVTARQARKVDIKTAQPLAVQADGELLGFTPACFQVLPRALSLAI